MIHPPIVPEISPLQLARALEAGEPIQVLDVRAPESLAGGTIDIGPAERFHNMRGSQVRTLADVSEAGLDPDLPVAVVCGHGNSSRVVTEHLNSLGARAQSVQGGFSAWALMTVPRELDPPSGVDALVQFDRLGKGSLAYLVVSGEEAFVVDPPLHFDAIVAEAEKRGARIVGVADTHVHADYVSGASRLSKKLGVPYHLHADDNAYPYDGRQGRLEIRAIRDGDTIPCGRTQIGVHHNPGHTLGSTSYLLGAGAALTGDFFFVQSIGRPDLAGRTAEWTAMLWRSVVRALGEWPGTVRIHPGHYSSATERNADRTIGATLDSLRTGNAALRHPNEESFTAWVAGAARTFPEAYRTIKAVNVDLVQVTDEEAETLEVGKNECALG